MVKRTTYQVATITTKFASNNDAETTTGSRIYGDRESYGGTQEIRGG